LIELSNYFYQGNINKVEQSEAETTTKNFFLFNKNNMKNLLTVTAIAEFGTGLVLVSFPGLLTWLLFGSPIDTPVAVIIAA